jgi:predicted PurR-regulated permease PerM
MSDNNESGNRRRIKDIDKEGLEKILGFYEEKSKNFSRWFALLLGLSVFFFFIIFIPYISTLASHYRISQESNQLQSLIWNFTSIQNQIQELRSNLNGSGQELKTFFEYLMANYTQNLNACRSGTQAVRYIQTAKSEVGQVKEYIQEGSLSDLDIRHRHLYEIWDSV